MRPIDADVLKVLMMADSLQMMLFGKKYELSDAMKTVNNAPTIDAVPVIRCKDCMYWSAEIEQTAMPEIHRCKWWRVGTYPNDYCGRAERKEE